MVRSGPRWAVAAAVLLAAGGSALLLFPRRPGEETSSALLGRDAPEAPPPALVGLDGLSRDVLVARRPPPGGVLVRLLAAETREPVVGASWRVDRANGETLAEGRSDAEGIAVLSAEAADGWERSRLVIWADGRRDEHAPMPEGARGSTVEILLARFHVDFEGVVLDDRDRPVEGAGVVVEYWNWTMSFLDSPDSFVRTTTDAEGRFRLSAKVWHPDLEGIDGHILWAGAAGFLPASATPDKKGEKGIVLRLARDPRGGVVEVEVVGADGAAAAGARLWMEGPPADGDAHRFAEVWRVPGDPRRPGRETWESVQGRATWHHVTGPDGRCVLHPVDPGRRRLQVLGSGAAADVDVDVLPPPAVTRVRVALGAFRTVEGSFRVERRPDWACDHPDHPHVVWYRDWPVAAEGGFANDAFRLVDVPPRAAEVVVLTADHPAVVVPLPEGAHVSVGEVVIPAARAVRGTVRWPEGFEPEPWSGVRVEEPAGRLAETTTFYRAGERWPRFVMVLTRRPAADAWIVVRLRQSQGGRSPEFRFDGPFDFVSGRPIDILLPDSVPPRQD